MCVSVRVCELGEGGNDVEHMSPVVPKRLRDTDIKGESEKEGSKKEIDTGSVRGLFTDINPPPKTTVK